MMGKRKRNSAHSKTRRTSYVGHVIRNPNTLWYPASDHHLRMDGKRNRDRRRTSWLKNLRQMFA